MKKAEKTNIIKWAKGLSDEELAKAYYDTVDETLGSQAETMYEYGYDMADIVELQSYEKFIREKADLLEKLCRERNIPLYE